MNILFIAYAFPPVYSSSTFRSEAFTRCLTESGHTLMVLCGSEDERLKHRAYRVGSPGDIHFPANVHRACWFPEPRHDSLCRRALRRVLHSLHLKQLIGYPRRPESLAELVANGREIAEKGRADVIYAAFPPPLAFVAADRISRDTRIPVVYDLHDPWVISWDAQYAHFFEYVLAARRERRILNRAAAVIANTHTAKRLLLETVGIQNTPIHVVPNGCDIDGCTRTDTKEQLLPGKFVVAYTGVLYPPRPTCASLAERCWRRMGFGYRPMKADPGTRSPVWFLRGVELLLNRKPELRDLLRLVFVGRYSDRVGQTFRSFPYQDTLVLMSPLSLRESNELCARSQLVLLLQISMWLGRSDCCPCVPGKLQQYLATGTRILAPVQTSEATDIIESLGAGTVVAPTDPDAIANALDLEIDNWRLNGKKRGDWADNLTRFEWRSLTRQLEHILAGAAANRSLATAQLHEVASCGSE